MSLFAADDADLAVLGEFGRRLEDAPEDPRMRWRLTARPEQMLPPLDDPWRVIFLRGGRGSGKTRAGAQMLAEIILGDTDGEGEYGVCAPTYADAWTKCIEGESGLLRALGTSMAEVKDHRSAVVRSAWRTYGQVVMRNGVVVYVDSADEGGLRIQGRNLKAAWCDEIGLWQKWEVAWGESLKYAVRQGVSKIIATGTPKVSQPARKLVRSLLRDEDEHGGVITRRLRTADNVANLSEAFYRTVVGAAKGTRLERQELEGELLDDVSNALWTRDLLDEVQCPPVGHPGAPSYLHNAVIGVDPSDGKEDSDEQAYTVIGRGTPDDPHLYVAENWGGQESPPLFARRFILKAVEWDARIVVEKNHGGEWMIGLIRQVMKEMVREGLFLDGHCPAIVPVTASKSKRTRAEPVAGMYMRRAPDGTRLVRHCKMLTRDRHGNADMVRMVDLEDQQASFTGAPNERSPDRLDSCVWAATPFLNMSVGLPPGTPGVRRWAGSAELAAIGQTEDAAMRRRHQVPGSPQETPEGAPWDLDGWAPADDEQAHPENGRRGNVRAWRLGVTSHLLSCTKVVQ